jgi:hypothetical protein
MARKPSWWSAARGRLACMLFEDAGRLDVAVRVNGRPDLDITKPDLVQRVGALIASARSRQGAALIFGGSIWVAEGDAMSGWQSKRHADGASFDAVGSRRDAGL